MGGMLNSFIVTNDEDSLLLKECAREANYGDLKIFISDFSRPRVTIPEHMLPDTRHPSILSIIHSENKTVMNVLVDMKLCIDAGKNISSRRFELEEEIHQRSAENHSSYVSSVDDLHQEISKVQEAIKGKEDLLKACQGRMNEAANKTYDLQVSFEKLCESTLEEIDAFEKAERELLQIESDIQSAEDVSEKIYYDVVMKDKVLHDIKKAEELYVKLEQKREEHSSKASIICFENEIESLGGSDGNTPEQLSAQLERLGQRLRRESQRMLYDKKERKIGKKRVTYKAYRAKLDACQRGLDTPRNKFHRNAILLKRQLSWRFNAHLGKKGISGVVDISYKDKTLSVVVKMPQGVSSGTACDTRGLSGEEHSFSTLCFALALHVMTEAPFRAMDEFDIFMDALSRKISLDTLVEFVLAKGSQWIFITPHDISMVKNGDRIKKQQMEALRI